MRSRFVPRLILLISLVALTTSVYVVCGFSRTIISDAVSGFPGTPKPEGAGGSRTSSPSNTPDDGFWEAATHVATTSGSSVRVRAQDIRLASLAHSVAVLTAWDVRTSDRPDSVPDRSPQHSIPLLI